MSPDSPPMPERPQAGAKAQRELKDSVTRSVPPLFLFGMERSGTTLLSMMVGAHPKIAVPLATTGMWLHFHSRIAEFNHLATEDDVAHLVDAIRAHERIKLWDAEFERCDFLADLPTEDFGAVVARFHREYARAKGKPYWANIDIASLDNMDVVNAWYPDARFLHIVRDGRDVALSHQTMPYGAGNIAECARAWAQRTTTSAKMGHILGPSRYLTVRFEDLVLEPQATLQKMCDFFGVEFDVHMLSYAEMVDDKIPEDRRWLWPSISRPPQKSKVGMWRSRMTRPQRIVFEGIANKTLKMWGYEAYERVPKSLAAFLLDLAYHLDQGGRMRRLRARFGFKPRTLLERRARRG